MNLKDLEQVTKKRTMGPWRVGPIVGGTQLVKTAEYDFSVRPEDAPFITVSCNLMPDVVRFLLASDRYWTTRRDADGVILFRAREMLKKSMERK